MKPDKRIRPHHDKKPIPDPQEEINKTLFGPQEPPAISPALAAALAAPQGTTEDEDRVELARMEAEGMDSLIAFTNALTAGLLQGVALSYRDNSPEVVLLVKRKDGVHRLAFTGLNIVDAFIQAGVECHTQLAFLSTKTDKVKDYMAWYRKRKEIRKGQLVIVPDRN